MIDQQTINRIKDSANIVDVVADFSTLKRDGSGGKFTCLCPFHEDRHLGSFKVSEAKNCYTCFSCGAHGGPVDFLMAHNNMSFIDAIKWLGAKYGIYIEGSQDYHPTPARPHTPQPPLPILELPADMPRNLMYTQGDNELVKWIKSLPWDEEQTEMIDKILQIYLVGNGREGHTVFWQVDEGLKVRTAKLMLYKSDGHRDKDTPHNFDFVHSILRRSGYWSDDEYDYKTVFFGQHLLDCYPDATINFVESEKTALICAIAYGRPDQHLWMATGGLHFLTSQRLQPFIDRHRYIVCYPDRDAIQQWTSRVKALDYDKIGISSSINGLYTTEDPDKADIADVIVRTMQTKKTSEVQHLCEQHPSLEYLIKTFNLQIVQ